MDKVNGVVHGHRSMFVQVLPCITVHQIFVLMYSKLVKLHHVIEYCPQLKLGNSFVVIFPNFQNCVFCEIIRSVKTQLQPLFGAKICSDICAWTLPVLQSSQKTLCFSEQLALADNYLSEYIYAPNGGCWLFIPHMTRLVVRALKNFS